MGRQRNGRAKEWEGKGIEICVLRWVAECDIVGFRGSEGTGWSLVRLLGEREESPGSTGQSGR